MTVDERRGSTDQFPVGLRVLAVDDDRSCLLILEGLLRKCKYHVTTTNQAITALKLLRENKNKFDLVISDVHMPDMDGFKLLELVGLEMDLPVIMLSGNSDPKSVMKGITHGACDYLIKPVRLEELKNIWQHVVRKKFDNRDVNTYDNTDDGDRSSLGNSERVPGSGATGSTDHNGKASRKRKDQDEEDDDACDEDGHENDDPSMQKKPRVVWSVELHQKFVAAVTQLGIDKAMPKRILDLMNVENLTRENVASHLQKFRLYLKKQANMNAAYGAKDTPYFHGGALDGVRNYHAFAGRGHLPNLSSYQQGAMLGRLNSPVTSGLYSLASPGVVQLGHRQNNSSNPIHDSAKLPNISFSLMTQPSLIQNVPTSLELNQFQQQKAAAGYEPRNPLPTILQNTKFSTGGSIDSLVNTQFQAPQQQTQSNGFGHHQTADPFEINSGAYLADLHRCNNDTWQRASNLTGYAKSTLPGTVSVPFGHESLPSTDIRDRISPVSSTMEGNLHAVSSSSTMVSPLADAMLGRDFSHNGSMLHVPTISNANLGLLDVKSIENSSQRWDMLNQDQIQRTDLMYNASSVLPVHDPLNNVMQDPGLANRIPCNMFDMARSQENLNAPLYKQNNVLERANSNDQQPWELNKLQDLCNSNDYSSFDDLMSAIVKREREDILIDEDIGCDIYPLGTCM